MNPPCAQAGLHDGYDLQATDVVEAALRASGASVERLAPGTWSVAIGELLVSVRSADGWLLLDGSPAIHRYTAGVSALWGCLDLNAMLTGNAKLAIAPYQSGLSLRAELPLDEGVDLGRLIAATLDGFAVAGGQTVPARESPSPAAAGSARLAQRCAEAGWPAGERPGGSLVVGLDVAGEVCQAVVESEAPGRFRVGVEIGGADAEPNGPCGEALATFLLRLSGLVRMVRAAARNGRACIEVGLGDDPGCVELGHAFAALSVACRLSARESDVLARDDAVARAYLRAAAAY